MEGLVTVEVLEPYWAPEWESSPSPHPFSTWAWMGGQVLSREVGDEPEGQSALGGHSTGWAVHSVPSGGPQHWMSRRTASVGGGVLSLPPPSYSSQNWAPPGTSLTPDPQFSQSTGSQLLLLSVLYSLSQPPFAYHGCSGELLQPLLVPGLIFRFSFFSVLDPDRSRCVLDPTSPPHPSA